MLTLNYRDSRPIYEQIRDELRKMIVTGALRQDEKLPSVRSLATELSINPNTIQRAYSELENAGYVYSVAGRGSFVGAYGDAAAMRRDELCGKAKEILGELKTLGLAQKDAEAIIREVYEA